MKASSSSPKNYRDNLIWFLLVSLGSLIPAGCYLAAGRTLVWRDTAKLFLPVRSLVVHALRSCQLPLWNPHEALGIPLFAQMMHGVLHPFSLLGAFLFPDAGMDFFIIGHFWLASLGAAVLARTLGGSFGASAVAGFAYGLSGYTLGMSSIVQYLSAAAVVPWMLAAFRLAGEGRRFGVPAAALALAVQWFAGDPQWAGIAVALALALAADAAAWAGLKRAAAAALLGTAVAAVQLLPTLSFLKEASRGAGVDALDKVQWAFAPWRTLELFAPGFFGSVSSGAEKWPVFMWLGGLTRSGFEIPFVPSVYVGSTVLALAAAGISRQRLSRILCVAALLLFWLALGCNAGADSVGAFLPVWNKFRYAEKMIGPFTLCLALLAAFGTDRLSRRPGVKWTLAVAAAASLSLVAALALSNWTGFEAGFSDPSVRIAATKARQNLAVGLLHSGAGLAVLMGIIELCRRRGGERGWFPAACAFVVLLQLALASGFALHPGRPDARDGAPLAQLKKAGEQVRILTPIEEKFLYPQDLDDHDAQVAVQSHMGEPAFNLSSRIDQFNTYTGLVPERFHLLTLGMSQQLGGQALLALRRYGITHAVIKDPYTPWELQAAQLSTAGGVKVLEDARWGFSAWQVPHRPWAFFAKRVQAAPDARQALNRVIESAGRNDATVVLEGAPGVGDPAPGRVLGSERGSDYLRIEATCEGSGVLVINDSFWPGWQATLDGHEAPLWRADYLVRAVPFPPGRHVLEMRYTPWELKAGWVLTLCGAVALLALLFWEWRDGRSGKTVSP